jgi:L-alanine-DL-glutamate epimerase-like enolase superfamily enzyme
LRFVLRRSRVILLRRPEENKAARGKLRVAGEEGRIRPSDAPGFGLELDEDWISSF